MTNAIIIGGGSGMGLALAQTLLAEGMDVTIAGRSADRLATARIGRAEREPSRSSAWLALLAVLPVP